MSDGIDPRDGEQLVLDLEAIEAKAIGALRALEFGEEADVEQVCLADIPALTFALRESWAREKQLGLEVDRLAALVFAGGSR